MTSWYRLTWDNSYVHASNENINSILGITPVVMGKSVSSGYYFIIIILSIYIYIYIYTEVYMTYIHNNITKQTTHETLGKMLRVIVPELVNLR